MPQRIETSLYLPYRPERVWTVLADFAHYRDWNPLNIAAEGMARVGSKVAMRIANPLQPGTSLGLTVMVTRADPGHKLGWRGHVPLLFSGDHLFELHAERGGTRLKHSETIGGLLGWWLTDRRIETLFVPAYRACDQALAARLEALDNVVPLRAARR